MKILILTVLLIFTAMIYPTNSMAATQIIKIKTAQGYVTLSTANIDSADVELRTLGSGKIIGPCKLVGTVLEDFLSAISFADPMELGYPGGMYTGKITLHFNTSTGLQPIEIGR